MRLGFALFLFVAIADAQQLHVTSATAKSVRLEWSGTAPEWSVERKLAGGAYQKLAPVKALNFEDTKIEPYATYRYRVSTGPGSKPSNEVVVGPPPMGVMVAAGAPEGVEPSRYGTNIAVTRDENGDPALAFVWADPNGDSDPVDTEVRFVRWNRATYAWTKPVRVAVTGDLPSQYVEPISIACDPDTGAFLIATSVGKAGVNVAISRDAGATWQTTVVQPAETAAASTAIAVSAGTVHLATNMEGPGVSYITGPIADDPSKWKTEVAPNASGWKVGSATNIALALDAAGHPVIARYETQEDGAGRRVEVWRPGAAPVVAFESNLGTDYPNLALTSGGGKLALVVNNPTVQDSDSNISYESSTDGATWSKPVMIPADGPRSTNQPESVALGSAGQALVTFGSNTGSAGPSCGGPVVSRSSDGTHWKTCGFGRTAGADFEIQPSSLRALITGDDTAYVVWHQESENKYGRGVLIWHGR